ARRGIGSTRRIDRAEAVPRGAASIVHERHRAYRRTGGALHLQRQPEEPKALATQSLEPDEVLDDGDLVVRMEEQHVPRAIGVAELVGNAALEIRMVDADGFDLAFAQPFAGVFRETARREERVAAPSARPETDQPDVVLADLDVLLLHSRREHLSRHRLDGALRAHVDADRVAVNLLERQLRDRPALRRTPGAVVEME